jgi:predicted nucleic acid-binding protein
MSDRIYIETSPLIDVIKGRVRVQVDQDRLNDVWHVEACLRAALAGDIEVVTSMLTIAECRRAKQGKPPTEEMKKVIRSVLASGKVFHLAEVTQTIAETARDLEWEHGINLSGADAVHVATAFRTGCKEFFTLDGRRPNKKRHADKSETRIERYACGSDSDITVRLSARKTAKVKHYDEE